MLVEASGNGTKVLELVEEALDAIAQSVDRRAEGRRVEAMIEGADVGVGALIGDLGSQRVGIVAAVGQQHAILTERAEHVLGTLAVVGLAFGQLDGYRQSVRVDERVDLGRKPAAGTAHATAEAAFFSPLAAC